MVSCRSPKFNRWAAQTMPKPTSGAKCLGLPQPSSSDLDMQLRHQLVIEHIAEFSLLNTGASGKFGQV